MPALAYPVGSYVPYKGLNGSLLYTSGMIPVTDGKPIHTGKLGADVTLEQAQDCARLCVLNALAWVENYSPSARIKGVDGVSQVIQVRGFVACTADFYDHPKVLNAASDLLVDIFGDAGRHTRAAVGCISLPLNVPVEIDFLFAL